MNAVVNDNSVIGESAIVAALAFVKAETVVPPRTLVGGVPAKPIKSLTDADIAWKRDATRVYQELAVRCRNTMQEVDALTAVEPDRRRFELQDVIPLYEFKKRGAR